MSLAFVLSLTQRLVFLSLYVTLSILLSILVCAAASFFCVCLVSVHVSAPYVIAGSTQELYTCIFRQMARLLLKRSRCLAYAAQPAMILRCISMSWFFLDTVVLSQVCVALNIFYKHIVHVDWVLSTTITLGFAMFILRRIRLLSSASSCSICCNSCGVPVHKNMSSAKRRLLRKSPSVFTPLFSQSNLKTMLSSVAVNSLGEMVSP